jgi:uncharacterized membrane protein required for colicin V production
MNWFSIFLILVFAICVGFLHKEGIWNNALKLVNVVTAALLATNFWEPLATWLDGLQPGYTYVWDFVALWGLFSLLMLLMTVATDYVSKVRVHFLGAIDRYGGAVLAVCIAWVMVCFTAMTMHTAPLPREFLFGSFQPEHRAASSWSPEMCWLGTMQRLSEGPLRRSASEEQRKRDAYVFDPRGEFIPKYTTRRTALESQMDKPTTSFLHVAP